MTETLLVTGASGQLGRGVIHHLLDTRKSRRRRIIATTRDPANLADLAARGVIVRAADFDERHRWPRHSPAPTGCSSSRPTNSSPGKRREAALAAVAAAKAGRRRASALHLDAQSRSRARRWSLPRDHYGTEQAIKASGIPYTIFRNGWYQENLFMALPQACLGPVVHLRRRWRALPTARATTMAAAIAAGLASGHGRKHDLHADRSQGIHCRRGRGVRHRGHRQADPGHPALRRGADRGHEVGRPARSPWPRSWCRSTPPRASATSPW